LLGGVIFLLKRRLSKMSLLIWGVVIAGTIPQFFNEFKVNQNILNSCYNYYTIFELIFYFFSMYLSIQLLNLKKLMLISGALCVLFSAYFLFSFRLSSRFINEWVCINDLFFAFWCLLFFYQEIIVKTRFEINTPPFYYILGIFIYVSSTLVFLSIWFIVKANPSNTYDGLKIIHHIFNCFLYILFFTGLIRDYRSIKRNNMIS
jgi:hypothetical protein